MAQPSCNFGSQFYLTSQDASPSMNHHGTHAAVLHHRTRPVCISRQITAAVRCLLLSCMIIDVASQHLWIVCSINTSSRGPLNITTVVPFTKFGSHYQGSWCSSSNCTIQSHPSNSPCLLRFLSSNQVASTCRKSRIDNPESMRVP